ncbi:MAG TPA: FtsX-like permease family protein, partial [Candidatus Saccharimonadales bacterium]|nr:FtsX-like permease family protein [Candidatus Saccharimonadales bacterium]
FIVKEDLNKIQLLPNVTNFFLVNAAPGTDVDKLVAGIDRDVPGVEAVAKPVFVDNNVKVVTENILPIILVLLVIGVVVGIAVIALTIFTSTIEKATEYGVLKAIGFRNGQLYRVVAQQALIAGVIGYTVGALISVGLSFAVPRSVPQFVTQIRLFDLAWILGLTLGMSILAAYIPTRRLAKIDPAEVFRG